MDTQQLALLDDIEADLTAPRVESRRSRGRLARVGAAGAMLAAGATMLALPGGPANAATGPAARPAVPYCGVPNPVPRDHTKSCDDGAWYLFTYVFSYPSGPGGQYDCYVFDRTYFGCGGESDAGTATACTG